MPDGSSGGVRPDPLYTALLRVEDAMNEVGSLTVSYSGAYCGLTDAIRGFGNLEDARYRFAMEASLLSAAHDTWKQAVAALNTQVEDGVRWQQWIMGARKYCGGCGVAEKYEEPFRGGWCSDCIATNIEARDQTNDHSLERYRTLAEREAHPDNVLYEERIQARERADDDAAATRSFYGA